MAESQQPPKPLKRKRSDASSSDHHLERSPVLDSKQHGGIVVKDKVSFPGRFKYLSELTLLL